MADTTSGVNSPSPAELAERTFAYAREAEAAKDWAQALARWDLARRSFPDRPTGHIGAAVALRELGRSDEAEAVIGAAMTRFPDDPAPRIGWAAIAHGRGDWTAAAERWASVRTHFPQMPIGYALGLVASRALDRKEEAEAVLDAAVARFPEDARLRFEHAVTAAAREDWPVAAERWAALRRADPAQLAGYSGGAAALRSIGRLDEAEAVLAEALARFPRDAEPAVEHGWIANLRRDWPEAVRRWEAVRQRFPDETAADAGAAQALRQLHRFDEAEALVRQAQQCLPHRAEPLVEYAWVAQDTRDWPEAVRRWEAVRERLPDHLEAHAVAAEALAQAGRFDEAEALAAVACERFAAHPLPFAASAKIAGLRGDAAAALARWHRAQQRFPNEPEFAHRLFEARLLMAEREAIPTAEESVRDDPAGLAARDLMMRFESLGSGCEFGDVQRRFGAEPLGLLRWASVAPGDLCAAIEAGFAGIAAPENLELTTRWAGEREIYWLADRRYGIEMHTFVDAAQLPRERMLAEAGRRLDRLRLKLIEDMQAGDKIFVYRLDRPQRDRRRGGGAAPGTPAIWRCCAALRPPQRRGAPARYGRAFRGRPDGRLSRTLRRGTARRPP